MILRIWAVVFFSFYSSMAMGQLIYATDWEIEADVKVYVTNDSSQAHLLVYLTKNNLEIGDSPGIWAYTAKKVEAKKIIFFTRKPEEADLIIYYTRNKGNAGYTPSFTDEHL